MAAVAILVVNVPPSGLLRSQPEFRIASAPLDFTSASQREQKDGTASQPGALQVPDLKKSGFKKRNFGHLNHVRRSI